MQSDCQSLIAGDPLDALTQQQSLEADVGRLREHLADISLQPLIKPWMRAKEVGPCDEALNALVDNFKLSYDADSVGVGREGEGEGADDQSGNESESSVDSLMGESGGLSDVLEVYRLRSLENRRTIHSNIESEDTGEAGENQVYSQETQAMASNFAPLEGALGLQRSERGHDLNWLSNPPSANFSLFNRHMVHGRSSLNQVLDDSGSNSDPDNLNPSRDTGFLRYSRPRRLQLSRDSDNDARSAELCSDDSDREIEEILERHQSQAHELGSSSGAGVDSVLDSLEIRRHWNFLNGGAERRGRAGEDESSKEEDGDDEEEDPPTPPTLSKLSI